jgi:hypothetical protein
MLGLQQDSLKNQAVGTVLWEFARITDHTVVPDQFLILSSSIISYSMRRAGIVAARQQYSFSVVRQPVWELFNIANLCIHPGFSLLLALNKMRG